MPGHPLDFEPPRPTTHNQAHNDHARALRTPETLHDRIARHRRSIAFLTAEIGREDWQLGRDAEATRRLLRSSLNAHRELLSAALVETETREAA